MNNQIIESKPVVNTSIADNIEDPSILLIEEFEWIPLFDTTLIRNLDVVCPNYTEIINNQATDASAIQVTNHVVKSTTVMIEVKTTFPQQKLFSLKEVTKPLDEFQSLALNLQFEMKQYSRLSLLELGNVREMSEDDYVSLVKVSLIEFYNRLWESQSQVGKESFKLFLKQKPKPLTPSSDESKPGKVSPSSKRSSRPLSATLFANKLIHKLSAGVGRTNSSSASSNSPTQSQCNTPKSLSPPLSRDTSVKKLNNASRFLKSAVSLSAGNTPTSNLAVQLNFESEEFNLPPFTLKVTADITLEKLVKAVRNKCILDGHPIPTPNISFSQLDELETKINSENLQNYLTSLGEHYLLIISDDSPSQEGSPDATLLTPGIKVKLARSNTQVVTKRPQPRQQRAVGQVSRVLNGLDLGVFVGEAPIIPPRRKFTKSPHSDFKKKVNTLTANKLSLTIPAPQPYIAPCENFIPQLDSERSSLEDSSSEKDSPITPTSSPQNNPIILNFKQKNNETETKSPKATKRASKFFRSLTMKFDKSSKSSQSLPTSPTLVRSQTSIPKGSPSQKETLVFKNLLEGGVLLNGTNNNSELIGLQSNGVQHLNISVKINHDLKYQFELDPYQPTYTSVMNRVIYHFSQIEQVPLRILNDMKLVYLSEDGNIELNNTQDLQKLIGECKGQSNLDLLLVPKTLLNDTKRKGIQWELPPNLYDLGLEMEGNQSQSVIVFSN